MMRWVVLSIAFTVILVPIQAQAQCTNPESPLGAIIFNEDHDVYQGCTTQGWWSFHEYPTHPCTETTTDPAIGETCTDGSIYAGLSPDGGVPMYTTPADAASTYTWNDGSSNWVDTSMDNCDLGPGPPGIASCNTGEENTALLVALNGTGTPAPYNAAEYCDALDAHGHQDWYLPAIYELVVLYDNRSQIGAGTFGGTWYWSSSEWLNIIDPRGALLKRFDTGAQGWGYKDESYTVRCVRK